MSPTDSEIQYFITKFLLFQNSLFRNVKKQDQKVSTKTSVNMLVLVCDHITWEAKMEDHEIEASLHYEATLYLTLILVN